MLERYIEKCVIRQVYLCEQLYEKESVLIDRLAGCLSCDHYQ